MPIPTVPRSTMSKPVPDSGGCRRRAGDQPIGEIRRRTISSKRLRALRSQAKADLRVGLTDVWVVSSLSMQGDTDPAGELGRRLDLGGIDLRNGGSGGAIPQWLANRAAESVVRGERPVVLITGAEALATRKRLQRTGALDNMLSSMREAVEAGSDRPPSASQRSLQWKTDPGVTQRRARPRARIADAHVRPRRVGHHARPG